MLYQSVIGALLNKTWFCILKIFWKYFNFFNFKLVYILFRCIFLKKNYRNNSYHVSKRAVKEEIEKSYKC
jgi:hypothetical protein